MSELMDARAKRAVSESACEILNGDDVGVPLRSWLCRGLPMRPPSMDVRRARGSGLSARFIARARSLATGTAASSVGRRKVLETRRVMTHDESPSFRA
jgi:hypothetical protein